MAWIEQRGQSKKNISRVFALEKKNFKILKICNNFQRCLSAEIHSLSKMVIERGFCVASAGKFEFINLTSLLQTESKMIFSQLDFGLRF